MRSDITIPAWISRLLLALILTLCVGFSADESQAEDLDDCALLFDSAQTHNSDINFEKICQFYGLRCRQIDLRTTELTDQLLRDANGQRLAGMGINLITLEQKEPTLLDSSELTIMRAAIDDGAHLLISGLIPSATADLTNTRRLTDDGVTAIRPAFTNLNWIISGHRPEITREFSGQTIPFEGINCATSPILADSTTALITSQDRHNPETEHPVLAALTSGAGTIFVDGGQQKWSLNDVPLTSLYKPSYFHNTIPTMMFIRFSGGNECWHNRHNYANLTIDDPTLSDMEYGYINFQDLLGEMEAHDFCTTIGFVPRFYTDCSQEVVDLFLNNPHRYSIVHHGNNHEGFEFFAYDSAGSLAVCLERGWCDFPIRPLAEQEADIVESASRMAELQRLSGLPYGRAMIFPFGISPAATLQLLKAYNFTSTVNPQSVPIGEEAGSNFDFDMRPLNMNYANFASSPRRHWQQDQLFLFDFFVDRPLFIYEHHVFFEDGPHAFSQAAETINGIAEPVQWRGLGDILRRLHLQKNNDDGTISVWMFTNNFILSNETTGSQQYHIRKDESFNVPLVALTVDGLPTTYSTTDSSLSFSLTIPASYSKEIEIQYGSGDKDFAISETDISFDPQADDTLTATVHNLGSQAGPVPVQLFQGHPDSGGIALKLVTIERIAPHSTEIIKSALREFISGAQKLYVILDPHDLIRESNEDNNWTTTTVSIPEAFVIDDFEYDDSPLNHGWSLDEGSGEVTVVFDSTLNSRVLEANTDQGTGFAISHSANDSPKSLLSLKMRSGQFFLLYVRVQTTIGEYYLRYTPDEGVDTVSGSYVHLHLGSSYQDSYWHTIQRDLAADVSSQLDGFFSRVKFFVLRGSYRLDDLVLSQPSTEVGQEPKDQGWAPLGFSLLANYPNPFNLSTTITYRLFEETAVKLQVYNIQGQRVVTLAEGRQPAGIHSLSWNGQDESGLPVASGVYLCALEAVGSRRMMKMVLLR